MATSIIVIGHHLIRSYEDPTFVDEEQRCLVVTVWNRKSKPKYWGPRSGKAIQEFKEKERRVCKDNNPDNSNCNHTIVIDHTIEVSGHDELSIEFLDEAEDHEEEEEEEIA